MESVGNGSGFGGGKANKSAEIKENIKE